MSDADPKGLVRESYRIDGITLGECRSIFLDWALSVPVDADTKVLIEVLLERYGDEGHPMTQVLREGLEGMTKPKRRGGWRSRPRD
ncbi:hypothetical protein J4E08_03450 [Sagittula sp. NFXS13]|uniref:Uncharacterized protein n=1 Tax=Sagittula marina TaxID=943940 RepID=A0A7W6DLN2_9RHOB|nr:hypothetical protein [Sagittula marina]MBB3985253.1 hypothetical protein [Sagittula marina]